MSESIVADTLIEILTYSPQDQVDATRIIRSMTEHANGIDFSRVPPHPPIRTDCHLFRFGWQPVAHSIKVAPESKFTEIRHQLVRRRGEWRFDGRI